MIGGSSITRSEFVRRYMAAGFSYEQATKAFKVTVGVIEDAVVAGSRVGLGRVGALVPVMQRARVISMGFKRKKGGVVEKIRREYNMGQRLKWRFILFKRFEETHSLKWFQ